MWNEGYTSEIGYTYGCYRELSPFYQKYALTLAGFEISEKPINRFLELGVGQGLSSVIHAATSGGEYCGNDFNPSQIGQAQVLASKTELNCHLTDQSFEEMAYDEDLPKFDNISLHGVWSWVSERNQGFITRLLAQNLEVGGSAYLSYNVTPGWSPVVPIRALMTQIVERATTEVEGINSRIATAIDTVRKLVELNPAYLVSNKGLDARIEKLLDNPTDYLAHEYFNSHWQCIPFNEMAKQMEELKLTWATSVNLPEQVPSLGLTPDQLNYFNGITDRVLAQTIYDIFVNQQFRRDIFVKGARRLSVARRASKLSDYSFIPVKHKKEVVLSLTTANGQAHLNPEIYQPIIDILSDNSDRPLHFKKIREAVSVTAANDNQMFQALGVLTGFGYITPCQSLRQVETVLPTTVKLNRQFCELSKQSGNYQYLASPVAGTGIIVGRMDQLFCLALIEGVKQTKEIATFVWRILDQNDEKLLEGDKTLNSPEENIDKITTMYTEFEANRKDFINAMRFFDQKL